MPGDGGWTRLVLVAGAFVAGVIGTALVHRYALSRSVMDVPNERSSHDRPVPRGGGLGIVVSALLAVGAAWWAGWLDGVTSVALAGGGGLVAAVGWLDDHISLSPLVRASVHLVAAIWAVAILGGMPPLGVGNTVVDLGVGGDILAVVGTVWMVNLYNFMDGIDGIAAGEAVVVAAMGGALGVLAGGGPESTLLPFLIAAACAAFLPWNWPPARIFMGDVGSGFLGYTFAVISLASEARGGLPLVGWIMLLGIFVFDATATLLRRGARGDRWYAAHREHAYQRAVRSGYSHRTVTTAILLGDGVLAGLAGASLLPVPAAATSAVAAAALFLTAAYLWVERRRPMRSCDD